MKSVNVDGLSDSQVRIVEDLVQYMKLRRRREATPPALLSRAPIRAPRWDELKRDGPGGSSSRS